MNIQKMLVTIEPHAPGLYLLAVKENGEVAGMTLVRFGKGENAGWITDVFVQVADRGRGFGKRLLLTALDACRDEGRGFASLAVGNDNEVAKKLYESLGFLPFMDGQEGHTQYVLAL